MSLPVRISKEYDNFGRLIKETHSDGFLEEISYSPDGEIAVISTTYPNGEHECENYCKIKVG